MGIVSVLLIVIFVTAAVFLTVVILLQDEQGEGLGGIFGGGSSTPFGSRSGNVLTRFTSVLGAIFLFCAFGIAWLNRSQESGDVVGAAKRAANAQTSEWWLTPVNGDAKLPTAPSASTSTAAAPVGTPPATAPASTGTLPVTPPPAPSSAGLAD